MTRQPPLVFCESFDPDAAGSFDPELDRAVVELARRKGRFTGRCNLAGAATDFAVTSDNLRESLVASASGSSNRQRQMVAGLARAVLGRAGADLAEVAREINRRRLSLYVAEAGGLLAARLRELVRDFECSEYFGEGHRSGERVGGILHQDLQATSFPDERFDVVLTGDVLEHVPDAPAAEREICRILKPEGIYCFTVPFLPDHEHDVVRAEAGPGGTIVHHLEPEYHDDPIRPVQGALVYRVFSHRGLRSRFEALGCAFTVYRLWSKGLGILGKNCMVMVARKDPRGGSAPSGERAPDPEPAPRPASPEPDPPGTHAAFPDGHFYSPVVDVRFVASRRDRIWPGAAPEVAGIEFDDDSHRELLERVFPRHIAAWDYPETRGDGDPPSRFYTRNPQFSWLDARALFVLLRHWRPARVVEVGSGYSSLLIADVKRRFLGGGCQVTCIEPYPPDFLAPGVAGVAEVRQVLVQDAPLDVFTSLGPGDVLFIDSSHVAKTGSDVNFLVFEVLPRLRPGVRVHFHDVFLPLDYPWDWVVEENRSWNEQYVVRALLLFSDAFRVVFGSSYAHARFPDLVGRALALPAGRSFGGGSLWIERVR